MEVYQAAIPSIRGGALRYGKIINRKMVGIKERITIECERLPERTEEITFSIKDKQYITPKQRAMIYALCRDIARYTHGTDLTYDEIRRELLSYFAIANDLDSVSMKSSEMSRTTARELIYYVLGYMLYHDIELSEENHKQFLNNEGYVYQLVLKRKCVCCGQQGAHIHHVGGYEDEFDEHHASSRVGMGNNRQTIEHIGKQILPLCYKHHNEAHSRGDNYLFKQYHIVPVIVDERLEKKIKGR